MSLSIVTAGAPAFKGRRIIAEAFGPWVFSMGFGICTGREAFRIWK